jgi:hypothetical protein
MTSTACWRGYIGTWEIRDSDLYLVALEREQHVVRETGPERLRKDLLLQVFPGAERPIPATWFSGVLRLPQGAQLRYIHMGYVSIYERDLYLTVKSGKVIAELLVDNRGIGATRSTADFEWMALADAPLPDNGNWLDARLFYDAIQRKEIRAGTEVVTRGLYIHEAGEKEAVLWIPPTPTTAGVGFIFLELGSEALLIDDGVPVEVKIRVQYEANNSRYTYSPVAIRALKPGESIHHAEFKVPEEPVELPR